MPTRGDKSKKNTGGDYGDVGGVGSDLPLPLRPDTFVTNVVEIKSIHPLTRSGDKGRS